MMNSRQTTQQVSLAARSVLLISKRQYTSCALALRARALLLVFEKFTRAYLFQIALEIM